jgi:UDP-glucuronate decarboxylase
MKIILVTGGAGFIGSNLCNKLIDDNNNYIICLDNLSTGSLNNISHLLQHNRFEFIRHDITQKILLEVDEIYHLACPASPKEYQANPIKTIKTCIFGTMNMLGLAKRTNAKILLSSTSEIYGNPLVHPQTEEYFGNVNTIGPRSCYDESKRLAESIMFEYYNTHNVDIRIARIFNTYGLNMNKDDGRVISNFINQAIHNDNITIYGDGMQTRSFCYIEDMVNGLIKLMNSNYTKPINIGNPTELTIKEIANKIITLTQSQSNIIYMELPQDDPIKRKPDITKATSILNWTPTINIKQGLLLTINYYKHLDNSI